VLATRIGNVRLDLAGSRNESGRLAGSVLGEYRFALPARRWVPRVSLLGHYRHPAFTGVSAAGDTELPEWNLTATLAQPLPLGVGMNVSLRHQIFPTDRPEVTTLSGGLSRSVGRNASVTATAGASFSGGQTDWGARIVFSLSSSEPRTTVSVVQDVEAAETDVRVSQTRSTSIGRLTLAGSGSGLPPTTAGGKSVSATARLSNQRLETSLVQGFRFEEQDPAGGSSLTRTNTSLQFGTGVYFADGVPAMGRPARGGFVVTRAPADVPVDRVVLGTGSGTTQARTSWLGPAVLAGLSPYTSRTVNIDPVGLPVDYSLGPTTFTVEPGNRRGTVVPLEAEKRLYARGTLISAQGEEIALQALRVSAIEGPAAAREAMSEISSFTDESGTFELYDLYPGTYRVRVLDGSGRTTRVTIPEEGEVLVDLGRVELAAQEAEE
jgi:outer membrane usher protein FimD/PapC